MKNKTLATYLCFIAGPMGLHRFYLKGGSDWLGWLLPIPSALGIYGILRARQFGLDDQWSWVLIPMLGFTYAGCALNAIIYGLMSASVWNERFNPQAEAESAAGGTHWFTIFGVGCALLLGTTVLMSSIVFSFQRYFEYQIEQSQAPSK